MRMLTKVVAAISAVSAITAAGAYTVSPLRIALTPSGAGTSGRVTITNSEAQPITVAFKTLKNSVDAQGKLTPTPAGGELVVFPPRAVIQPGKSQSLQVRYTGAPSLGAGLYSIHVAQVPVNSTQGQAQIKVATEFYIAALVQPNDASANMQVKGTSRSADGTVIVTIENSGTGIGRMSSGTWTARSGSTDKPVEANAFEFGDTAYIMPGSTRTIRLKPEAAASLGTVDAMTFTAHQN